VGWIETNSFRGESRIQVFAQFKLIHPLFFGSPWTAKPEPLRPNNALKKGAAMFSPTLSHFGGITPHRGRGVLFLFAPLLAVLLLVAGLSGCASKQEKALEQAKAQAAKTGQAQQVVSVDKKTPPPR
jgi:hypothetical protein